MVASLVVGGLLLASGAASAAASSEDAGDRIADLIDKVAPAEVATPVFAASGDAVVTEADRTVTLPGDGSGDVVIDTGAGFTVPMGLPTQAEGSAAHLADDGTVVYETTASVDVAVQVLDRGVRVATVLADSSAPTEYVYSFGDFTPRANADGSVTLTLTSPEFTAEVGRIEVPWAVDSTGASVPTRYVVKGNAVVQEVDHTSGEYSYPIVADPQYGYGLYFYVFFNRAETATIATMGWGAAILATACGFAGTAVAGPAGAAVGVAACGVVAGSIVYQAGVAQNSSPKKCVRLAFPWLGAHIPSAATYRDSRCA